MIIGSEKDVTKVVLAEYERTKNPRLRAILAALIRHVHEFAREVKLTEQEFHAAMAYIVAIGNKSNETHNEAVLMAGSLGLSSLICLLNNGDNGNTETDANMLGPFWRMDSPATKNGASIVRSPTPGPVLFVDAWFRDTSGKPIDGAEVDIWQSSPEGFYENQDPLQADMNLRGKFTTDKDGHIAFRSVKPAGYPIPIDGPVGELLRAAGRHKHIETDVQFGVTRKLIGNYIRHDEGRAGAPDVKPPWYSLEHTFVMERGTAQLPRPPISGKAQGERPEIPHLEPA